MSVGLCSGTWGEGLEGVGRGKRTWEVQDRGGEGVLLGKLKSGLLSDRDGTPGAVPRPRPRRGWEDSSAEVRTR